MPAEGKARWCAFENTSSRNSTDRHPSTNSGEVGASTQTPAARHPPSGLAASLRRLGSMEPAAPSAHSHPPDVGSCASLLHVGGGALGRADKPNDTIACNQRSHVARQTSTRHAPHDAVSHDSPATCMPFPHRHDIPHLLHTRKGVWLERDSTGAAAHHRAARNANPGDGPCDGDLPESPEPKQAIPAKIGSPTALRGRRAV